VVLRSSAVLLLALAIGAAVGVLGYTFVYARGASYLTNDPRACANCHVMSEYYAGWITSPHRSVAVCNDCHTPPGHVAKYATKAANGFWHSFAFTTGRFPEALRITPRNRGVTERACRGCHDEMVQAIDHGTSGEPLACLRCHSTVGHL
jgi:cytochrome c nitrite reductase small subunit